MAISGGGDCALVVGVDPDDDGDFVLECALRLATTHEGTEVHVLQVSGRAADAEIASLQLHGDVIPLDEDDWVRYRRELHELENRCEQARLGLRARGRHLAADRLHTHLRRGRAAAQIVALAEEVGAHLVVVGTHGRQGIRRLLLGSVAEEVVRLAPCPVYVARRRVTFRHEQLARTG